MFQTNFIWNKIDGRLIFQRGLSTEGVEYEFILCKPYYSFFLPFVYTYKDKLPSSLATDINFASHIPYKEAGMHSERNLFVNQRALSYYLLEFTENQIKRWHVCYNRLCMLKGVCIFCSGKTPAGPSLAYANILVDYITSGCSIPLWAHAKWDCSFGRYKCIFIQPCI